jgi:hypothetical protein
MYSVYITDYNSTPTEDNVTVSHDELYIYDPITHDEGLALIEPILSLKVSKVCSFSCTIPPTNYGYGKIIRGLTRIVVLKDDKVKFMGRINTEDRDLYLNQELEAEGALAYLNDTLSEKKIYTYSSLFEILSDIFKNHNEKFPNEPWKQFHLKEENCKARFVGRDDTNVNSNLLSSYSVNFDISLELVTELVNLANGTLKIEYNEENGWWDVYIYNKYELPASSNQPIEFGLNLLDLVQNFDMTEICTAVAPFGGELIQKPTEIGEAVAGEHINVDNIAFWYPDYIYARENDNNNYDLFSLSGTSWFEGGYWSFKFNIAAYNAAHPKAKLTKIYISCRGYRYDYDVSGSTKICDCAWRINDSLGAMLGFKAYEEGKGFMSWIDEEIDLTSPQYLDATTIYVTGWGNLITPSIRRNAIIVGEPNNLSIKYCDSFDEDAQGLRHPANSPYLYSDKLIRLYGLIEKKLDYEVEDTLVPVKEWSYVNDRHDNDPRGTSIFFRDSMLGYDITDDDHANEGNYQIIPYQGDSCIQFELPDLYDPNRPRALFISSRESSMGDIDWDGRRWRMNGQFAIYDTAWQVLAAQSCETNESTYKSIKNYLIDLSLPEYYGAKYVRVGGFGGIIGVDVRPSDDTAARDRLMELAKSYLTDYQWEKVIIEATAVDLNLTSDEWESFDICTSVAVNSSVHGLDTMFPLTELDIQLDALENNSIKLGYDSDEYLSAQLAESSRLASVAQTIEERRMNNAN